MSQYLEAQHARGWRSSRTNKRRLYPAPAYEFASDRFIVLKDSAPASAQPTDSLCPTLSPLGLLAIHESNFMYNLNVSRRVIYAEPYIFMSLGRLLTKCDDGQLQACFLFFAAQK